MTELRFKLLKCLHKLSLGGQPVTQVQLAQATNTTPPVIHKHIQALETLGYITVTRHAQRLNHLHLTDLAQRELGIGALPIAGEIAAGVPRFTQDHLSSFAVKLADLLPVREGDYLLTVKGHSMEGIGIYPGDTVHVHPTSEVNEGEVAVVSVSGENTATLKRVYFEGEEVILISEHPDHPPMRYPKEQVIIQGVMMGRIGGKPPRKSRPS